MSKRSPYHPEELINVSDTAKTTWSLFDIVQSPSESPEKDTDSAAKILRHGLKRALLVTAYVYAADAAHNQVPPGFTSQFKKGLTNPSPEGLMTFLKWSAARSFSEAPTSLQAYINDVEKSEDGWFSQLSTLRNRWAHPDEYDVSSTLEETHAVLSDPPSLVTAPTLAIFEDGEVHWTGTTENPISLKPFVRYDGTELELLGELGNSNHFPPSSSSNVGNRDPSRIWFNLKIADQRLEEPTSKTFDAKYVRVASGSSLRGAIRTPGQLTSFPQTGAPGLLTVPALATTACLAVQKEWPGTHCLPFFLEERQSLRDPLSALLGLKRPPSWQDLCSFQSRDTPYVFVVDTRKQKSIDFLQRIYELVELQETCEATYLRFILLRSEEQVAADQERIWNRLPSHLGDLLYPPTANPAFKLPEHLWTPDRRFAWYKRPLLRIRELLFS